MRKSDITLKKVRDNSKTLSKPKTREYRASDFLTNDEMTELQLNNIVGRKNKRKFDDVDAKVAQIIARFGYQVYELWNAGRIDDKEMDKWLIAETARERSILINLELVIASAISALVKIEKGQPRPKGVKNAVKIIKKELEIAKGEI